MVPQYFGYLNDQTNVPEEKDDKSRFLEVMHCEILIDRNKWKPVNEMIDDIILNAFAISQRKEDA